jgi:pimeloyl-[acyl-carrier protein] methyl ester esterase
MDSVSQTISQGESRGWAEVLAYHGWGYSSADWQGWQNWLGQRQWLLKAFDRGYFGSSVQLQFNASATAKLIFVHSYGLHLCPVEILMQADLLVIFSSFRQFHPEQTSLKKRSQQILQQMIIQFERQPDTVLQNFKAKCSQPINDSEPTPDLMDASLLCQDLHQLNICALDLLPLQQIPKIVVLHGAQDRIVPVAVGKALADELAASYFEIESAGHALPFMQAATCQAILQPILEELRHES